MVHQIVVVLCAVLGLASHQAFAQWSGMGQGQGQGQGQFGGWGIGALGMGQGGWGQAQPAGLGRGGMFQQEPTQYKTCIAKNSIGDEMRVTFSRSNSNNNSPWFGNRFGNALRLTARIASNQAATLQGQFQLVVTEYSRTEEVCSSRALGDILTDRTWWSQSRTPRGIVGTPVTIYQGQTATSSETVENLSFEELTGRGLALCPSHQISGSTCLDVIPLCCKIGYDSRPATTSFTNQNQLFGQGLLGMPNPGSNNGNGGGFGQGVSGGMGGGFNGGLGGGMNPGMGGGFNGGGLTGPMNQGLPAGGQGIGQGNVGPQGMNNGLNNAGTGNMGGLTFQSV
ncbi:uncharacterized protein [Haliotis asinina]|uniref:uncharacterized protein n=1 Tax=Haliotis asinina TaxID=109174 RepID=UPI003531C0C4